MSTCPHRDHVTPRARPEAVDGCEARSWRFVDEVGLRVPLEGEAGLPPSPRA